VTLIGILNIPSTLSVNASQLYSKNIYTFLDYISPQLTASQLDMSDDIVKGCLVTYRGECVNAAVKQVLKL
jgi:H+-translocating NAD(P) transhydrogenase subunit alpha